LKPVGETSEPPPQTMPTSHFMWKVEMCSSRGEGRACSGVRGKARSKAKEEGSPSWAIYEKKDRRKDRERGEKLIKKAVLARKGRSNLQPSTEGESLSEHISKGGGGGQKDTIRMGRKGGKGTLETNGGEEDRKSIKGDRGRKIFCLQSTRRKAEVLNGRGLGVIIHDG